jgi:hypothetical protein
MYREHNCKAFRCGWSPQLGYAFACNGRLSSFSGVLDDVHRVSHPYSPECSGASYNQQEALRKEELYG